jgi:GAF domain-containing protein
MSSELNVLGARYQAGAGDGGSSGTAWSRGQSPAPASSGAARDETFAQDKWWESPAKFLLDVHADTEHDSLWLLALTAKSALLQATGHAFDCAVTLIRPEDVPLTAGNSNRASGLAAWDQETGDGPVAQALGGRLAVVVNAASGGARWPAYRERLRMSVYRSVASVPLQLSAGHFGAMTLLATKGGIFTPGVLSKAMAFGEVAATSLVAANEVRQAISTANHLRSAIKGRTSIDVACGVIMARKRCSYDEALGILVEASSHNNAYPKDVAETILDDLPGGAPAVHFKR